MAIDWDREVLGPVMGAFGEGEAGAPASLPVYTPRGLSSFALADAVFDDQYLSIDVDPESGTQTSTTVPCLGVRVGLFPRPPAQNDSVSIPSTGKTYIVRDVKPDGHGHSRLMLMEAG